MKGLHRNKYLYPGATRVSWNFFVCYMTRDNGRLTELAGIVPPYAPAEPRPAGLDQTRGCIGGYYTESESETAFLVKNGNQNARTAQRRPGAGHRGQTLIPGNYKEFL